MVEIDAIAPWEEFHPTLDRVWRKPDAKRKSRAGRKPMDALYNLSDDQIEYRVHDWLSFMRCFGFVPEDRVPDARTVWSLPRGAGGCGRFAVQAIRRVSGAAGRSSTPPSCLCRAITTSGKRTRRSRPASCRRVGPTSPPCGRRRALMRVGPSSMVNLTTATSTT